MIHWPIIRFRALFSFHIHDSLNNYSVQSCLQFSHSWFTEQLFSSELSSVFTFMINWPIIQSSALFNFHIKWFTDQLFVSELSSVFTFMIHWPIRPSLDIFSFLIFTILHCDVQAAGDSLNGFCFQAVSTVLCKHEAQLLPATVEINHIKILSLPLLKVYLCLQWATYVGVTSLKSKVLYSALSQYKTHRFRNRRKYKKTFFFLSVWKQN